MNVLRQKHHDFTWYFLTKKVVDLVSSRLWKQGVPAIRTWHRSAGGKQRTGSDSPRNWNRLCSILQQWDWLEVMPKSTCVHMMVCPCLSQNPQGSSKPLTGSSPYEAYLIIPLYALRVGSSLYFLLIFFHSTFTHYFYASKTANKSLVILTTILRRG